MHKFVKIDNNGVIQYEVETNIYRQASNFIKVEDFESVRGKKWNGTEWVDYISENEPIPEPEYIPSNTEIYENQMIIMSALADIAEMQMGVE